jgi:hypothetical protein
MADNHYVDNKQLYECIVQYKNDCIEAKRKKLDKPPIPNYVGECIMMIAERLSHKPNFINYSFRDEMISDGIENCISYFDNFDPAKSTNPFAYFTQIIYYAFLRRILKEKKQQYVKHKSLENSLLFDDLISQMEGDDHTFVNTEVDQQSVDFIKAFEDSLKDKKSKKKKKKGIEIFLDE